MQNLSKGMLIGGVFASQTIDKSGEIIDIDGMDISTLNSGESILNSEHQGGHFSNYLGRIVSAKKIYKYDDCKSKHEKICFKQAGEVPILYGMAELFDDEDHAEAKAAASVIKHFKNRDLPIAARFSIEGQTLDRNGMVINNAVASRVALTITPCNSTCVSDVLSQLNKSERATYEKLVKNNTLTDNLNFPIEIFEKNKLANVLEKCTESMTSLKKSLEAGYAMGSTPADKTQGVALQRETTSKTKTDDKKKEYMMKLLKAELFSMKVLAHK